MDWDKSFSARSPNSNTTVPPFLSESSTDGNSTLFYVEAISLMYMWIELALCVAICFGNGMIVASFFLFPAIRTKLPHHWLLHLAFADLLLGLSLPFHIYTFANPESFQSFGDAPWMCLARYASAVASLAASHIILTCLAGHILLSLKFPYRYNAWIDPTKIHAIASFVWAFAVFFAMLPFLGVHEYNEDANGKGENGTSVCEMAMVWSPVYLYVMVLLMFLVTVGLCSIYFVIYRLARKTTHRDSLQYAYFLHINVHNYKPLRTFVAVSLSTFFCFMPFAVVSIVQSVSYREYSTWAAYLDKNIDLQFAGAVGVLILFLHSCLNPVIYSLRLPAFRKAFRLILTCQYSKYRSSYEQF